MALGRNGPLSTHNENKNARCHCKRRRVSCPGPGRAADVILAFVRPNKTAFMSDKCLIFGFACGVHRVPVRRARPRSIDVEFDQPKPAHLRPSSTLHPGGANKHRRCPQRPAGAPGANASKRMYNVTVDELDPTSEVGNMPNQKRGVALCPTTRALC